MVLWFKNPEVPIQTLTVKKSTGGVWSPQGYLSFFVFMIWKFDWLQSMPSQFTTVKFSENPIVYCWNNVILYSTILDELIERNEPKYYEYYWISHDVV